MRAVDESPGNQGPLELAAGETTYRPVCDVGELDLGKDLGAHFASAGPVFF